MTVSLRCLVPPYVSRSRPLSVELSPPRNTTLLQARSGAFLLAAADNLGGETALHLAAKNGSENVLRFLLAAGCWAETKDTDHRTPLASACAGGRIGTAAMLLSGIGWGLENVPEGKKSRRLVRCGAPPKWWRISESPRMQQQ